MPPGQIFNKSFLFIGHEEEIRLAYYVGGREKRHGVQLLYFKKSHIN
jgi:hypothetical protein